MKSRLFTLTVLAIIPLSGIVATGFALAQEDPIKQRQDKMKIVGKSIGTVAKMAKGETEFDGKLAQNAFTDMQAAAQGYTDLFPEGTQTGGSTEAAPAIWSDRAGFEAKHEEFTTVLAQVMQSAPANLDALRASLGQVGRQCSACHETYRLKK